MCNFAPQFDYRKILITTYLIIKNNDCSTSKRRRKHLKSAEEVQKKI